MHITVILCTYQRFEKLGKALKSVAASQLPPSTHWEVLVVDNNSSDRTREVVEDFVSRHPDRFRYIFEPRSGKSFALNTGVAAARGSVLAFMDDDVVVEPTWLEHLTAPIRRRDCVGCGGRILPQDNAPLPKWLRPGRYAYGPLVMFDLGPNSAQLTEPPYGTNMAFRKGLFAKYGNFRTDLGPRPGSQLRGEDTEFGARLLAGGETLRYEPFATVYHEVPEHRLRKDFFLAWWFDKGRAEILELGVPRSSFYCLGVPFAILRRLVVWTLRWMTAFNAAPRFECKLKVWGKFGEILECYRARKKLEPATRRVGILEVRSDPSAMQSISIKNAVKRYRKHKSQISGSS
jgi:glucosyl-dolichyl phosphate glucuronosyltransferase